MARAFASGFMPQATLRKRCEGANDAPHPAVRPVRSTIRRGLANRRLREAEHLTPGIGARRAGGTFFPKKIRAPDGCSQTTGARYRWLWVLASESRGHVSAGRFPVTPSSSQKRLNGFADGVGIEQVEQFRKTTRYSCHG